MEKIYKKNCDTFRNFSEFQKVPGESYRYSTENSTVCFYTYKGINSCLRNAAAVCRSGVWPAGALGYGRSWLRRVRIRLKCAFDFWPFDWPFDLWTFDWHLWARDGSILSSPKHKIFHSDRDFAKSFVSTFAQSFKKMEYLVKISKILLENIKN